MLIVDAGPLYAAAATRDTHHRRCVELLSTSPGPLVVPALVVTEVAYLLPLGVVDASVIALAERHGADTIATLDRRRFGTVKPRHADAFALVP